MEEGHELDALECALTEIERVRELGFGAQEVERAKANLLTVSGLGFWVQGFRFRV